MDIITDQYSNGNLLPIINFSKLSCSFHEQYVTILALTIALSFLASDFLSLHFTNISTIFIIISLVNGMEFWNGTSLSGVHQIHHLASETNLKPGISL